MSRTLKLLTISIAIVNLLTEGDFATAFVIILFYQYIEELLPTPPTPVEVDMEIPIEFNSAVEVVLGNVSLGAPTATCSVVAGNLEFTGV